MRSVVAASLLALAFASSGCVATVDSGVADESASTEQEVLTASDTVVKVAVTDAAKGLYFMSESDHALTWVNSNAKPSTPANAAFVHRTFNAVTNNDTMADKPLSSLKSETVNFESFAARFKPVKGEDPDLFAYHTQMTKVLDAIRSGTKNPVVLRFGRASGGGLVGAISVYILGTLPSGRIGGVFTVSVET